MSTLRFVIRRMLRRPRYVATVVTTLAIGFGVSIAIFHVVDRLLLNPLPFARAGQLVFLTETHPTFGITPISYSDFLDWRSKQRGFTDLAGYCKEGITLLRNGDPERIEVAHVTASIFHVLGSRLLLGRGFTEDEDSPNGARVAVLDENFWITHLGARPSAVGETLILDGEMFEIVGVMSRSHRYPENTDVYLPLGLLAKEEGFRDRGAHAVRGIGRLQNGVSLHSARASLAGIAAALEREFPDTNRGIGVNANPLVARITAGYRAPVTALAVAAALVLVVSGINASSLMLARRVALRGETSVQIALGASFRRVLAEIAFETSLLALLGGVAGLAIAAALHNLFLLVAPPSLLEAVEFAVSWRVMLAAFSAALVAGAAFSVAPVLFTKRLHVIADLKESGAGLGGTGGRKVRSLHRAIILSEVLLCTILLITSGLLIDNFFRLRHLPLGFNPSHLLMFQISLSESKYGKVADQLAFFDQLRSRLRSLPQINSVATSGNPPFGDHDLRLEFSIHGEPEASAQKHLAQAQPVSPEYFATMRIPFLKGRDFNEADIAGSQAVAIIDDAFAQRYWPNRDPIGRQFDEIWDDKGGKVTIIGVVATARHNGFLSAGNLPQMYYPDRQNPSPVTTVIVRTDVEPMALAETGRKIVAEIDPEQPLYGVGAMEQSLASTLGPLKLMTLIVGIFAVVTLLLASIGIYSLMSFLIEQRRREIGIRLALGARRGTLVQQLLKENLTLVGAGAVLACLATIGIGRIVSSYIEGIATTNPASSIAATCLVLAASAVASYLASRRIFAVDPARVLHEG